MLDAREGSLLGEMKGHESGPLQLLRPGTLRGPVSSEKEGVGVSRVY
jgi:hypothetical protein